MIDTTVSYAAGVGGGFGGAAIGTLLVPGVGTVVGGIVGGIAAASLADVLVDWLTRKLFDVPKDVALENAYAFLGISCSSSNSEINSAYRKLALRYHSDKGGDQENWDKHYSMGVIKLSKGDL